MCLAIASGCHLDAEPQGQWREDLQCSEVERVRHKWDAQTAAPQTFYLPSGHNLLVLTVKAGSQPSADLPLLWVGGTAIDGRIEGSLVIYDVPTESSQAQLAATLVGTDRRALAGVDTYACY
ncbi:MAG: hypothetical protein KDA60_15455 [Planctomycetales bacterium]|nr:hypothetical protein [Planctomycetales bacterium]